MISERHDRGRLLRGAPALARYIFGDEEHQRTVYTLVGVLPIFMMGGRLCAYTGSLDRAIAAKEAGSTTPSRAAAAEVSPEEARTSP